MKRGHAVAITAMISMFAGFLFATFPLQWIELRWGLDLDAHSGLLEFLLATIPLSVGTIVLAGTLRYRVGRRNEMALKLKTLQWKSS